MRVRENLALQTALIVFFALTAVLAVTTFIYYQSLRTEQQTTAQLQEEMERLRREHSASTDESESLKFIVGGYSRETPLPDIHRDHALDSCEVFSRQEVFDTAPYRDIVSHLVRSVRDSASREVEALERERDRQRDIEEQRRQNDVQLVEHRRAHTDLVQQLVQTRQQLNDTRDRNVARWRELVTQIERKAILLAEWELKHDRLKTTLTNEMAQVKRQYDLMRDRWEDSQPDTEFVSPLANVKHVDGRTRTVIIDLGRADVLPLGLAMSVFEGPADNLAGKKPKGKIEVIRIVDEHSAETRIVEDRLSDVILPGDVVYTPVWKPGQRRRFALVGKLDIDGDGKGDIEKIRGLIRLGGGAIDAVVDERGEQTGEISIDTRYLVMGALPSGAGVEDTSTAFSKILKQADELGVDRMSLEKLLDQVGYSRGPAAEQLSSRPRRR